MSEHAIDIIRPELILRYLGKHQMAFAEALKGTGGRDDGNFFDFMSPWTQKDFQTAIDHYLSGMEKLAVKGIRRNCNFMEFWGWPEIRVRDDGAIRVYSRIRLLTITMIPQERPN